MDSSVRALPSGLWTSRGTICSASQCTHLHHGAKTDDILALFSLTAEEKVTYKTVRDKFEEHFITRRNVIYEQAKFNFRIQREDESVDRFVTALYMAL